MAEDNSGRNTSRIVVLYVDYNYQQGKKTNTVENNVVERSQTVTNNR